MYALFINGKWVDAQSGKTYDVINPANREVVAKAAYGNEHDAELAVQAAHQAFAAWSKTPATTRAEMLRKLSTSLIEHAEEIARLVTLEMGKPIKEARTEVKLAADYLLWNAEEARRMYGYTIPASQPNKRLSTIRQAVGPVAAITPWNFPISMVARKIGPALAAGCTIVFKPASQTPGSANLFFKLADQVGFPRGVMNLVTGSSSAIGNHLLTHPLIRKVTFTGSTEVGKHLMKLAAGQVKRVSMELGGHAPFIVFADAHLEKAVDASIASKFRNNGQTCICANRIYVEQSIKESFVALFTKKVQQLKIGNGLEEDTDLGPLVDQSSMEKVEEQVSDAMEKGATLATGGHRIDQSSLANGYFYAPTVLLDVTDHMAITSEETFGPIAPIYTFESEAEVIQRANDTVFGLSAYLFTNDLSRAHRVAEALDYGMIGINDAVTTTVQGPFGGFKESGMGKEGGPDGLHDFTEIKFISTVIEL
jgi:succinate-semialdehyde dehydrogenase/glutarate-semialdehyde dehydrogenase